MTTAQRVTEALADESGATLVALAAAAPSDTENGVLDPSDEDALLVRTESREAIAEMLFDLMYIRPEEAAVLDLEDTELPAGLVAALEQFRAEDPVASGWGDTLFPMDSDVPVVIAQRLEDLVGFDGTLTLSADAFVLGARTSETRALHYHLRAFGVDAPAPDSPVSESTGSAMNALCVYMGRADLPAPPGEESLAAAEWSHVADLVRSLGDVHAVVGDFLGSRGPWPTVVLSNRPDEGKDDPVLFARGESGESHRIRKSRDVRRLVGRLTEANRKDLALNLQRWPGPSVLYQDAPNGFGIALIQLLLWMRGYYVGRVDGIWGAKCAEALDEAVEDLELDRGDVIVPLRGGYLALDLRTITDRLLELVDDGDLGPEVEYVASDPAAFERMAQPTEEKRSIFSKFLRKVSKPFRWVVETGRKVYRSFRRVLTVAARAVLKGFRWLGDQLANLVGPARHLVRAIARAASALKAFGRGLKFVLRFIARRPQGTSSDSGDALVLTRFDFDADAVVGVVGRIDETLIEKHMRKVRAAAKWSGLLMSVAIKGVRALASLTGPVGWLRLAFTLGGAVREIVANWDELQPAFS